MIGSNTRRLWTQLLLWACQNYNYLQNKYWCEKEQNLPGKDLQLRRNYDKTGGAESPCSQDPYIHKWATHRRIITEVLPKKQGVWTPPASPTWGALHSREPQRIKYKEDHAKTHSNYQKIIKENIKSSKGEGTNLHTRTLIRLWFWLFSRNSAGERDGTVYLKWWPSKTYSQEYSHLRRLSFRFDEEIKRWAGSSVSPNQLYKKCW